jgi:DNA polymerase zeta
MTILGAKSGSFEQRVLTAHQVCATCAGTAPGEPVECVSLDCPWLYARKKAEDRVEMVETMDIIVDELDRGDMRLASISSEELSDSSQVDM